VSYPAFAAAVSRALNRGTPRRSSPVRLTSPRKSADAGNDTPVADERRLAITARSQPGSPLPPSRARIPPGTFKNTSAPRKRSIRARWSTAANIPSTPEHIPLRPRINGNNSGSWIASYQIWSGQIQPSEAEVRKSGRAAASQEAALGVAILGPRVRARIHESLLYKQSGQAQEMGSQSCRGRNCPRRRRDLSTSYEIKTILPRRCNCCSTTRIHRLNGTINTRAVSEHWN
jgi:hypothetical protein